MTLLAVFVAPIFLCGLISARTERNIWTSPIIFTAVGMFVPALISQTRESQISCGAFLARAGAETRVAALPEASRNDLPSQSCHQNSQTTYEDNSHRRRGR
jgi:hypothetical protein